MHPNKFLKGRPLIYGIRNLLNGKLYVGKTHCFYKRVAQYKYDLEAERSRQLNPYLLAAIKKAGVENFEIFVLEFCALKNLSERELFWMNHFQVTDRNFGYNLRLDSSSGMMAHPETRALMSSNLKIQWAEGVRKDHSKKLKRSWKKATPLRRKEQSERFRKSRTKFEYRIVSPTGIVEICAYLRLKELGIYSALGNMCRSGLNETRCNGYKVNRYPIGE